MLSKIFLCDVFSFGEWPALFSSFNGSNLFHLVIGSKGGSSTAQSQQANLTSQAKKYIWASSASFTELNCQVSLINIKNCRCNDRVYTCRYTRCVDEMCVVVIVVIFPRTNTHNILRIEGGGSDLS